MNLFSRVYSTVFFYYINFTFSNSPQISRIVTHIGYWILSHSFSHFYFYYYYFTACKSEDNIGECSLLPLWDQGCNSCLQACVASAEPTEPPLSVFLFSSEVFLSMCCSKTALCAMCPALRCLLSYFVHLLEYTLK